MKYLLIIAIASLFLTTPDNAFGQGRGGVTLIPVPSTPDLTVSAGATADFSFKVPVDWIAIKNDCDTSIHIDIRRRAGSASADTDYPIKLGSGESLSGPFRVLTISASNDSGSAACTFTVLPARK